MLKCNKINLYLRYGIMRIKRRMYLLLNFYMSFAFTSVLITIICVVIFLLYKLQALTMLIWLKFFVQGVIVLYVNDYNKYEFIYYRNLGISKRKLWIGSFLIDMAIFIISLLIAGRFL